MGRISEGLKQFFEKQGLTNRAVAARLNVSPQYVGAIINGSKQLGRANARRWANEFGLSESWLLTGEGDMVPRKKKVMTFSISDSKFPKEFEVIIEKAINDALAVNNRMWTERLDKILALSGNGGVKPSSSKA